MADNATLTNRKTSFDADTNPDIPVRAIEKGGQQTQSIVIDWGGSGAEDLTAPNLDAIAVVGTGAEATAQRVTIANDVTGAMPIKSKEDGGTTLTAINTTYNNVTTSAQSADITTTGYNWVDLFFTIVSASTPTDITIWPAAKVSSNYFDYKEGYWGNFIFDDTAVNPAQDIWVRFPAPASGVFRMEVLATGTTAGATFTISNATVYLRT